MLFFLSEIILFKEKRTFEYMEVESGNPVMKDVRSISSGRFLIVNIMPTLEVETLSHY